MEQAIAEAARIAGAVADVDEAGGAEQSRTGSLGSSGTSLSRPGPQGLLQQQEQILSHGTTTTAPPSTQIVTSNATGTPTPAGAPTSTLMATSTSTSAAALPVSSNTVGPTQPSSGGAQTSQATLGQVPIVKNLSGTLANSVLCKEFRDYLILLDSKMPKQNKKFQVKIAKLIFQPAWLTRSMQVWLDLVLLCQTIFSLPEADESEKRKLMIQVRK